MDLRRPAASLVVVLAASVGLAWAPAAPAKPHRKATRALAHTAVPKRHRRSAKGRAHESLRILRQGHSVRRRPARPVTKPKPKPAPAPFPAPTIPAPAPADPNCTGADTVPTAATTDVAAAAALCLVNRERAGAGLAPLTANPQLAAAAAGHSADMVAQHYFSHDSLDGRDFMDRIRAAGWKPSGSWTAGENIAWGSGSYGTPRNIVAGWMNSAGHRANILNARYRETGMGVAAGAPQSVRSAAGTYTQDFGARS